MKAPTIFCSSCLLSKRCIYHGRIATFAKPTLDKLADAGYVIHDACAEMLGGLPCPRGPSRIRNGRVFSGNKDITHIFEAGADKALVVLAETSPVVVLLLKGSPSCDPVFGVFGKQAAALFPTIACSRRVEWRKPMFEILMLPPHQLKLFQ